MATQPGWTRRTVPLIIHEDGVQFARQGNNLICVQWSVLFASSFGWDSIFLGAAFPKSVRAYQTLHGVDTWKIIWDYLAHGFRALQNGRHPAHDPYGEEWPAGSPEANCAGNEIASGRLCAVIWQIAVGAEYACNELKVAHYHSNNKCTWCPRNYFQF